eukprot:TRINITY_DN19715_c0_g1_i1.p1 TRINITY_DN19715_c0_g1~~TRINITY_DN19715_c0_g1_i1.p1  ORF type:complete len:998 (+),score=351.64 TRINITY_DN19715_c0_g1_i1:129-2996(+)
MATDQLFEFDMVVCLQDSGKGPKLVTQDGPTLKYTFPSNPGVKIPQSECSVSPPCIVKSGESSANIAKAHCQSTAAQLLEGGNSVICSYGSDTSVRAERVLGPSGIAHGILEDLYRQPRISQERVLVSAYSYQPLGDRFEDLVDLSNDEVKLEDEAARHGGSNVVHLTHKGLRDKSAAFQTLGEIRANCQAVLAQMGKEAEQRAAQYREQAAKAQADAKEVADDDELDMGPGLGAPAAAPGKGAAGSPKGASKMDLSKVKLEPFIPGVYHDACIVVEFCIAISVDVAEQMDRRSNEWGALTFLILPNCARPILPGALDTMEGRKYEQVQRLNCAVLAVLNAIRMKRRRMPFGALRITSTFRSWYRQSMEREKEKDMIKRASIRKRAGSFGQGAGDSSPDASPRRKTGPPPPTRTLLLFDVPTGGDMLECFHPFVCTRRLVVHGSWPGLMTRHLACEQAQMTCELEGLEIQLEVAKQVHKYTPQLFGYTGKPQRNADGEVLTVKQREEIIRKKRQDERRERELARGEEIRREAKQLADDHLRSVQSSIDEVDQERQDLEVRNAAKRKEIDSWKNKDMSGINRDWEAAKSEAQQTTERQKLLEQERDQLMQQLKKQLDDNQRKKQELAQQQRKAVEDKERRVAEKRQWAKQQQELQEQAIRDLHQQVGQADDVLRGAVDGFLAQEKQALRGSNPSRAQCEGLLRSAEELQGLLGQLMPAAPTEQQQQRVELARRRVLAAVAHETMTLRKSNAQAGIPPPAFPSTRGCGPVPCDVAQPVVRVHLSIEGMAGLSSGAGRKGRTYSFGAMRNGRVHETPRRVPAADGCVSWGDSMSFLVRLPAPGEEAMDLLPCVVAEYMADGSLSESLPFDVDLGPLACQPAKQYVLLPLASRGSAELRVSVHVKTTKVRPKALSTPGANPLRPLQQLWKEGDAARAPDGDSSGDEGAPRGKHADPMQM